MADAVARMGGAVIYGCISTLGSSLLMFACQLTFFTKMATLMAGTIAFSITYTFALFVPLLALVGPQGEILGPIGTVLRCFGYTQMPVEEEDSTVEDPKVVIARPVPSNIPGSYM